MDDKIEWFMFDLNTGAVVTSGLGTEAEIATVQIPTNCRIQKGYGRTVNTYYDFLTMSPKERSYVAYDWNDVTKTLSNLPNPCVLDVAGVRWDVSDGFVEFSADIPGKYQIVIIGNHTRFDTFLEIELA